jgi:hypothetical protein
VALAANSDNIAALLERLFGANGFGVLLAQPAQTIAREDRGPALDCPAFGRTGSRQVKGANVSFVGTTVPIVTGMTCMSDPC